MPHAEDDDLEAIDRVQILPQDTAQEWRGRLREVLLGTDQRARERMQSDARQRGIPELVRLGYATNEADATNIWEREVERPVQTRMAQDRLEAWRIVRGGAGGAARPPTLPLLSSAGHRETVAGGPSQTRDRRRNSRSVADGFESDEQDNVVDARRRSATPDGQNDNSAVPDRYQPSSRAAEEGRTQTWRNQQRFRRRQAERRRRDWL